MLGNTLKSRVNLRRLERRVAAELGPAASRRRAAACAVGTGEQTIYERDILQANASKIPKW